jgi:hypothetical protein
MVGCETRSPRLPGGLILIANPMFAFWEEGKKMYYSLVLIGPDGKTVSSLNDILLDEVSPMVMAEILEWLEQHLGDGGKTEEDSDG